MRADCRPFVSAFFLFIFLLPFSQVHAEYFRRPVDICLLKMHPSHGGDFCSFGPTGNGCRFDCEPNWQEREDAKGIHYQCPSGTEVLAAAEGWALDVWSDCSEGDYFCGGGLGNLVILEHPGGIRTVYAGLSTAGVVTGQHLACGEVLGWTGRTGNFPWDGLWFDVQDAAYRSMDPFAGSCNPEFPAGLWVEQIGVDSARSCADPIVPNEGWIGNFCMEHEDCLYESGICMGSFPGGMCSAECETECPQKQGSGYSPTVCMATLQTSICVASCSTNVFPGTGCREGYVCTWVMTPSGIHEPGCLPETEEYPDGGVPDAKTDMEDPISPDVHTDSPGIDSGNDGSTDMTAGGTSSGCTCRNANNNSKDNNWALYIIIILFLFRGTKRVFSVVLQDMT